MVFLSLSEYKIYVKKEVNIMSTGFWIGLGIIGLIVLVGLVGGILLNRVSKKARKYAGK